MTRLGGGAGSLAIAVTATASKRNRGVPADTGVSRGVLSWLTGRVA
jgi:hypothetical protein